MARFTLEQKLDAVEDYLQGRGSYKSIAKMLGTGHMAIQ
jgi:transposase-like protein